MTATAVGYARPDVVDGVLDVYLAWREASAIVQRAYEQWRAAVRSDTTLAYAAYRAALEQEEQAATCYERDLRHAVAELAG